MLHHANRASLATTRDPNFDYVTLLMHGDGTNGGQNNTFIDGSTNNFTITRNGNVTQGSLNPFGDRWSNYFDGTGDYLTLADNTALEPSSSDLTWELWINTINSTQYATLYSRTTASFATGMWSLMMNLASSTAGDVGLYVADFSLSSPLLQTTGVNVRDNAWHHIAVVRNGNSWVLYVDGVSRATATWTGTIANIAGGPYIGRDQFYTRDYTGYISNLRIVKGTAVYTANFTAPTEPLTAITNTSLLTCQSNRFIDNSSNAFTITRNGDVRVQRFSPFNPPGEYSTSIIGGSGYFDGNGDYLSRNATTETQVGSSNFTTEAWVYTNSLSANQTVYFQQDANVLGNGNLSYGISIATTGVITAVITSGNTRYDISSAAGAITVGSWHHIALVRNGNVFTLYRNGVSVATTTQSITLNSKALDYVGVYINLGAGDYQYFNGYISNFRIVKGTAVYTANFTPPTSPLTAITNTSLLLNFTNASIIDNAMMNDLETVGNAQISTSVRRFGTGSMAFDGTGDQLITVSKPDIEFGSGNFTIELWVNFVAAPSSAIEYRIWHPLNHASGFKRLSLYIYNNVATIAYFGTVIAQSASLTWTLGQWYHLAFVRNGNNFNIYRDGTSVASGTNTNALDIASGYEIGTNINGYFDDYRVTKGIARYTANFTPRNTPFPNM